MDHLPFLPEIVGTASWRDDPPDDQKKEGVGAADPRIDAEANCNADLICDKYNVQIAKRHPIIATHWGISK